MILGREVILVALDLLVHLDRQGLQVKMGHRDLRELLGLWVLPGRKDL